jgi:hypothetical protein
VKDSLGRFSEARSSIHLPKPNFWNEICSQGKLKGSAAEVLGACEKGVAMDPQDWHLRVGRGLARALTGNSKGATEDFPA